MSDDVVEGTISVLNVPARCLFDSGSTHLFVKLLFASRMHVAPSFMEKGLSVTTPIRDTFDTDVIYHGCAVRIDNMELATNMVLLDTKDFNVILDMELLAAYHTSMDCFQKVVNFAPIDQSSFQIKGVSLSSEVA